MIDEFSLACLLAESTVQRFEVLHSIIIFHKNISMSINNHGL